MPYHLIKLQLMFSFLIKFSYFILSYCNSFEDQVSADFFSRHLIFKIWRSGAWKRNLRKPDHLKWFAVTQQGWEGAKIMVPAMAIGWHALLTSAKWSKGLLNLDCWKNLTSQSHRFEHPIVMCGLLMNISVGWPVHKVKLIKFVDGRLYQLTCVMPNLFLEI